MRRRNPLLDEPALASAWAALRHAASNPPEPHPGHLFPGRSRVDAWEVKLRTAAVAYARALESLTYEDGSIYYEDEATRELTGRRGVVR